MGLPMEIIRFSLVVLLLLQITLAWDAPEEGINWTEVRIYEVKGSEYSLVATVPVPDTQVSFEIVKGRHCFIARAFNGEEESRDSNRALTRSFTDATWVFSQTKGAENEERNLETYSGNE